MGDLDEQKTRIQFCLRKEFSSSLVSKMLKGYFSDQFMSQKTFMSAKPGSKRAEEVRKRGLHDHRVPTKSHVGTNN